MDTRQNPEADDEELLEYASSYDSSFSGYASSDASLDGDARHDYETNVLLTRPFRSTSPLGTGERANFFQEYRHLSRRNEQSAATMRGGYLSSVISGGLPPEPMHVVGGATPYQHPAHEQNFTDDATTITADGLIVTNDMAADIEAAEVDAAKTAAEVDAAKVTAGFSPPKFASSPVAGAAFTVTSSSFSSSTAFPATTIDLSGRRMGDAYASAIGGSVQHGGSGSCSLLMGSNRLSPRGAEGLLVKLAAASFRNILHLDLSGNSIGAKGVQALVSGVSRAPGSTGALHLRHLNVARNNLGDTVVAQLLEGLASVPVFQRTLKTLVADSNGAAAAACAHIELLLQGDHTLSTLSLAWNRIGSNGGTALLASGLFENNGLVALNLAWNCLGSGGDFMALGEAISRHERLVHVNLEHNHIGARDIEVFADDMERNHTILGVHLAGNRATVNRMGFIERGEEPTDLHFTTDGGGGRGGGRNEGGGRASFPQRKRRGGRRPPRGAARSRRGKKKKNVKRRKRKKRDLVMDQQKMVTRSVLHALFMLWMESGVKPARIFGKMDADGSGTVNKSEFRKVSGVGGCSFLHSVFDAQRPGAL
jgi:hypothetical protein